MREEHKRQNMNIQIVDFVAIYHTSATLRGLDIIILDTFVVLFPQTSASVEGFLLPL